MASRHHHQPYHPISPPLTPTTTACHCCCYTNYTPCHHPPPPDPHLHHTPPPQIHQFHPSNLYTFQQQPHHPQQQSDQQQQLQPIISSLLHRISALESTLKAYSSSTSSYPLRHAAARTIQTHFRAFLLHRSRTLGQLKHLASIKSNLNSLKLSMSRNAYIDYHAIYSKATNLVLILDSIQGGDPMIRDGKMSINRELNQFLKSIEAGYLQRSELSSKIEKTARHGGNNCKSRVVYSDLRGGNVKLGRREDSNVKVREQILRIGKVDMVDESEDEEYEELDRLRTLLARKNGVSGSRTGSIKLHDDSQAKVKKSVHFADNAYRFIRSRNEPVLIGECDSDDDGDLGDADQLLIIGDHRRENQENGILSHEKEDDEEEAQSEDGEGSPPSSNGGSDVPYSSRSRSEVGRTNYDQNEDGSFTFCAPLPVMMEPRADLTSRKKLVK